LVSTIILGNRSVIENNFRLHENAFNLNIVNEIFFNYNVLWKLNEYIPLRRSSAHEENNDVRHASNGIYLQFGVTKSFCPAN